MARSAGAGARIKLRVFMIQLRGIHLMPAATSGIPTLALRELLEQAQCRAMGVRGRCQFPSLPSIRCDLETDRTSASTYSIEILLAMDAQCQSGIPRGESHSARDLAR